MGQARQLVAFPAAVGLRDLLKYWSEPVEVTVVGMCAGLVELGGGEHRSQRRRSMSWQDLVRREGAVVDSFRQFPLEELVVISIYVWRNIPDVAVCKMPPSYRFGVVDGHNLPNDLVL